MARFKNISGLPQRLVDGNDEFVGFVAPSQVGVGEKYKPFVFPGSPIVELKDHYAEPEIRLDLIQRGVAQIRAGLEISWEALRPAERQLLEQQVLEDVRVLQCDQNLQHARKLRAELRRARLRGLLADDRHTAGGLVI